MLVYVRPSNEALLRARVPGAQDQRGCPSNPFHRARSASKKGTWPLPPQPTPLPKYSLWVFHEPGHQGTLILMGVWVSVLVLG